MSVEIKDTNQKVSNDTNWAPYPLKEALGENEVKITSLYLTVRDGVKIAVSVYLPLDLPAGEKRPTIFTATPYRRAFEMMPPDEDIRRYLANGYAWVGVDARGTGASFGTWRVAFSPEEIEDYNELIDWIVTQPWSNGIIGTCGISYMGTTAELTASKCNPAVKACMPMYAFFDGVHEIFPGGIAPEKFFQLFDSIIKASSQNDLITVPIGKYKNLQVGVLPVDEDIDRSLLEAAISEHVHNFDSYLGNLPMRFRDDHLECDPAMRFDYLPPGERISALHRTGIPFYSYSGYGDISYALGAVHRFLNVRTLGSKLVLGPWNHGGAWNVSPYVQGPSAFDHVGEQIRFFDQHLKGIDTGILQEAPVHYYTMVEEQWHAADTFPPPTRAFDLYLAGDNHLQTEPPDEANASDRYQVDYTVGTGETSRWKLGNGSYPNRNEMDDKLQCYTSAPLEEDLIVTGMPVVTLYLSANATDADVFAYLEEVLPDGRVHYITEGQLKALHRKVSSGEASYTPAVPYHSCLRKDAMPLKRDEIAELVFHMLPVSYMIQKGHCIRLALAGADADHFKIPHMPPPVVNYYREVDHPSHFRLPVEMR